MAKGKILGFIPTPLFIIAILAVGFVYDVGGFGTAVTDLWNGVTLSANLPGVTGGVYTGNFQFVVTIQDAITGLAVTPTGDAFSYWPTMPSGVTGGTAIVAAGHTFSALPSGECWISLGDASDFYFCEDLFNSMNSGWVKPGTGHWVDFADNNSPEYVVAIDTSKAGINGQAQTPVVNLVAPFMEESSTQAIDSPADVTAIGATESVDAVTWVFDTVDADEGVYITRFWLTVNNTIASAKTIPEEVTFSGGLVDGGGRTSWSAPLKSVEGSTSYHYYIVGDPSYREYPNGERYWYKTGSNDNMYITINFRNILGGDGYDSSVILYYEVCDGAGTITQDSDTIALQN